ncbi:hypothetical protein J2W32_000339 [Variovorax boronicumulans]|uniref:Uncharacterized protein n=1 Tax=Variovorax boronicumulans TaxID=436515 RepID=A0AAW8CQK9_9BURK|nr:hypothetical protein [Variovorax boronicumulans]MDP9891242.1 hypothetical protein [Variovorax boronicumulans]MDQ0051310.1 hypothetical protein [Variovorax boronicumulans]
MAYQGFSPKLELAKTFARAKVSSVPMGDAEKARRKQLAQARADKLREENLAQRALIESRRT